MPTLRSNYRFKSPFTELYLAIICICFVASNLLGQQLNTAQLTAESGNSCCYELQYQYDLPQGISSLETRLLNPGLFFSSIQYDLASGWQYETLQQQRRLRWVYPQTDQIPAGQNDLLSFCVSGWNSTDSLELLVLWRNGDLVARRDTLRFSCSNCWEAQEPVLECQADSSFILHFDFQNISGFEVDFLTIREPDGQDLILEESIYPSSPISVDGTLDSIQLHLSSAVAAVEEICFEVTPRHLLDDHVAIDCCTSSFCIPVPNCDRCCTPYEDFEAAVNDGFSVDIDCTAENVQIMANALNECDRVNFFIAELGGGIVDGNEPIILGALEEDSWYEVCMTVERENREGIACFEEASLTVCDSFYYDCVNCFVADQVDLNADCSDDFEPVCGCDGMTYLNSCAAESWAGLVAWDPGEGCGEEQLEDIPLSVVWISLPNESRLDWSVGGLVTYRYFLIQRMLPNEEWLTIGTVDPSTFTYYDEAPAEGTNKYRVLGITETGKIVFSNEDLILDDATLSADQQDIRCWPNPFRDFINIEAPTGEVLQIQLFNLQGQLLKHWEVQGLHSPFRLATSVLPAGAYVVQLQTSNRTVLQKRLIKQ